MAIDSSAERYLPNALDKKDMLGHFVRQGLSQRQVETEILLQLPAGSETTVSTITIVFLHLMCNAPVQTKLRFEIDLAIAEGRISDPITAAEARSLPYLQAVISEGLRILPPFTGLLQKEVPAGGATFDGQFVPEGTRIGHSIWAVTRRKDVFGADVEIFRPSRWLEASPEQHRNMFQVMEMVFGYGRWQCAGKSIAYLELNKIFVEVSSTYLVV